MRKVLATWLFAVFLETESGDRELRGDLGLVSPRATRRATSSSRRSLPIGEREDYEGEVRAVYLLYELGVNVVDGEDRGFVATVEPEKPLEVAL